MSDNVSVNPGTDVGAIDVKTDEILGEHHPFFKMEFGEDGTATPASETNPLPVIVGNKVSTLNSTTTPLGIDVVFTGTGEDISNYAAINIMVFADQDSAIGGLSLQWSSDNVNWDESEPNTVTANETIVLQGMGEGNYFRIVYTNGGTAQTAFRLHIVYKVIPSVGEVTHLDVSITDNADAQLTRSVIVGKKPSGSYDNIDITAGGNLKISLEEFDEAFNALPLPVTDPMLAAAQGVITGLSTVNKFGRNIEVDASVTADVWDGGFTVANGGNSLIWLAPTAARIHQITSSDAADDGAPEGAGGGAQAVRVWGLQTWASAESSEDVTLNGTANVATANSYVIINRMKIIPVGSTYNINTGSITAIADTDSTVTARIRAGQGQTQMTIYGLPSTQTLYMGRLYGNVNKAGGAAQLMDMSLLVNEHPDLSTTPFATKHTFGLQTVGTSALTINYSTPKVIAGPAIIKIQSISGTINMDVSAGFDACVITN